VQPYPAAVAAAPPTTRLDVPPAVDPAPAATNGGAASGHPATTVTEAPPAYTPPPTPTPAPAPMPAPSPFAASAPAPTYPPAPTPTPAPTARADQPHPALGPGHQTPSVDRSTRRRRLFVIAGIVACVLVAVGIAVAATGGGGDDDDTASTTETTTPTTVGASTAPATVIAESTTTVAETTTTVAAVTAPAPKGPPYPSGALQVGVDIPPGRYEADGGPNCYWERMRGSDGSERITNRLGGGHVTVDVLEGDTVFRSDQCGTWNPAGPFFVAQTEFDDGIWSVNTQIAAGKYRNTGSPDCYWARLRGFGGEGADIITNAEPTRPATVEILPGDVGFESRDCGHWTQVP
jgi:hypothetical protein